MLLNNIKQKIYCSIFYSLYVVVQFVWIAAFLVSTEFEYFRHDPPVKKTYCFFARLLLVQARFFAPFFQKEWIEDPIAAVPHPLISILPVNLKIEIGGITHERN